VTPLVDLAATVRDADYVVEAVSEDLPLKQKLFAAIEPHVRPDTILASNTSSSRSPGSWKVSRAASARFGTHWWNPPYLVPLVEVIGTQWTSLAAIDWTMRLHADAGKQPAHVKRTCRASSATACNMRSGVRRCRWSSAASAMPRRSIP